MLSMPPATTTSASLGADGLHRVVDGLQAGAALAHDGVGRHLDREAGLERRHPRQVGGVGALLGLADDDLVDRRRLDAGALDGGQDHDPGELFGRHVLQRPADPAQGGTDGGDDDDVIHADSPPHPQTNDIVPPST